MIVYVENPMQSIKRQKKISTWITDLTVKTKIIKYLEKKQTLFNFGLSKYFLDMKKYNQ